MIAFADLLRPNSERIEAAGVMPDINVMPNIDEIRAGRDPALERALAELATTVASSAPGNPRRAE
jgi:C-terminal processing protease CtpA/Prc